MSDTAQLFILAGIWSLIAAFIVRFIPKWWAKIIVFALLVGIPFWELPYGYYHFHAVCEAEARVLVFESISPQKNVCADYPFEDAAKEILKAGFESVEARGKEGDIRRYASASAADPYEGKQDRITANYCVTSASNIKTPWRVLRHDHLVRRVSDGLVVARQSRFTWAGTWWQEEARPILGRGGDCADAMARLFSAVRFGAIKGER